MPIKISLLDFSTLEKVSGSYVTNRLRDREDDIIWRMRWGDGRPCVYLLRALWGQNIPVNQPQRMGVILQ